MNIAFYKKSGPGATVTDKFVCWWTKGIYSHVELIINDNIFYSSAPRDNGVRYKELTPNLDNWDIFNLTVPLDENKMRKNMDMQLNKGYDWVGLFFGQLFKSKEIEQSNKWFCSELCGYILNLGGIDTLSKPFILYSPQMLYNFLENNSYVKRS